MDNKKPVWLYRIIAKAVWMLSPKYRLAGTENLPDEPCIIVGNHCQMYGPIAAEFYTPGKHATWCAGEMMHRKEVAAYAYRDFWSGKPKSIRWLYRLFSHLIGPLSELVFTNAHTVAVYRDARLSATMKQSIKLLEAGISMVIFPEHYDEYNNIIHDFQENFVDLARFYYKKTGRELLFVPMYLAPRLKTIFYGKPVAYNAQMPIAQERTRICRKLKAAITAIAVAQPEHTVIPYPNIPKKCYPKNIPLEVFSHEPTED